MDKAASQAIDKFVYSINQALNGLRNAFGESEPAEQSEHNTFSLSLAQVRTIAQAGLAHTVFRVGDSIISDHELGSIAWRVIGVDKHSVNLHMVHLLEDRRSFGDCNDWEKSELRRWLNDDKEGGFFGGFPLDDGNAIAPTEIITAKNGQPNKTVDRLYLLSRSEVGLGYEGGVNEGDPFPFFKDDESRRKVYADGDSSCWWLRSPISGGAYGVRFVDTSGALDGYGAVGSSGVAAACTIR